MALLIITLKVLGSTSSLQRTSSHDLPTSSLIRNFRLSMCLFLTNLEIPIVVTALVGITNDLGGFQLSSWIVAAYLLGYVGKYHTSYSNVTTN